MKRINRSLTELGELGVYDLELAFERGTVLTKEMLEELYDAPRDVLSILKNDYPDGVLEGFGPYEKDDNVYLRKGLVKYQGRIYRMPQDVCLADCIREAQPSAETTDYLLYLAPAMPAHVDKRPNQRLYTLNLQITSLKSEDLGGIEIARFRMPVSGIPKPYHRVDMQKPHAAKFWNMTWCPYSVRGGTTFHPYMFETMRPVLLQVAEMTGWKQVVIDRLASDGVLSMDTLLEILCDADVSLKESQREEILRHLHDIGSSRAGVSETQTTPPKPQHFQGGML